MQKRQKVIPKTQNRRLECEYQFKDGKCAIKHKPCFHATGCKYYIEVKRK